jgi:hypothetical protein
MSSATTLAFTGRFATAASTALWRLPAGVVVVVVVVTGDVEVDVDAFATDVGTSAAGAVVDDPSDSTTLAGAAPCLVVHPAKMRHSTTASRATGFMSERRV